MEMFGSDSLDKLDESVDAENKIIQQMIELVDTDEKLSQGVCSSAAESLVCALVDQTKTSQALAAALEDQLEEVLKVENDV